MSKILGLDLGITSVGYAVVNIIKNDNDFDGKILAAGARTFPVAENPKDGASLALPRREARSLRRILRRKAIRLSEIKNLFIKENFLTKDQLEKIDNIALSPWDIRKNALYNKIDNPIFAKALLHIAKRRGFKSMRKSQEETDKSETGKLLKGIKDMEALFAANKYQTIGEMFANIPLSHPKRNKDGSYQNSVARKMLEDEVSVLFSKQRAFGNAAASESLEKQFKHIAFEQRPIQSMEGFVGLCTLEPKENKEKRAPKNSYTAELFSAISRINNIKIIDKAKEIPLSAEQRDTALSLCFEHQANNFKQFRKKLNLPEDIKFNISYTPPKKAKEDYDAEAKTKIFTMNGFHSIKKALGKDSALWEEIKNDEEKLNNIAEVLSYFKSDEQISAELLKRGITQEVIDKVKGLSFSGFMHISLKAMKKLIPHLQKGLKYNEACCAAGYDFQARPTDSKKSKVPPIDADDHSITSPVVKRTVSQTIKVVNALNRKYGPFDAVHIELTREMGKNHQDRKEISSNQKDNEAEREKLMNEGIEGIFPKSTTEIKKLRLWNQQHGKCIYSGKYIPPAKVLEEGYTQIDHIIPYSLSFDNSFNNLVLCLTEENQNKKNNIPFDYFKSFGKNWEEFETLVTNSTLPFNKKLRLLKTELTEADLSGFRERNLNDTKHITTFIKDHLTRHLALSGKYKQGVFPRNGRLTADLRGWWGLSKDREESDRHHALDAIVVACCGNDVMQYISKIYRDKKENIAKQDKNFIPKPWANFRTDVFRALDSIFVSRPPNKKVTGPLHKDTYYSAKYLNKGFTVKREKVENLSLEDISKQRELEVKYFGTERNKNIYDAIEKALKARKDPKEPLNVIAKGVAVKKIRLIKEAFNGVKVLKGNAVAANGDMPRIDVFLKDGKYYIVPVYAIDFAKGNLPLLSKPDDIKMDIKDFVFSVFKDDYIEIVNKNGEVFEGYLVKYSAQTGQVILETHDRAKEFMVAGMKKEEKSIKNTTFQLVKKYQIDILGEKHFVPKEKYIGNIKKRKGFGGN